MSIYSYILSKQLFSEMREDYFWIWLEILWNYPWVGLINLENMI
jgi:hypothetical protein